LIETIGLNQWWFFVPTMPGTGKTRTGIAAGEQKRVESFEGIKNAGS